MNKSCLTMLNSKTCITTRVFKQTSVYTQYSGKSGVAIKNAIYDANSKYVGEVNFRNHGNGYVSGHVTSTPGDISSAHLPQNHLMPKDVPVGWSDLFNGHLPPTLVGE